MKKFFEFIKKEIVFCVAALLAAFSMLLVPPSSMYLSYIDFRVLALLFCLMVVVAELRNLGVFEQIRQLTMKVVHNTRSLAFALVMTCFFLSMWITNDVSLITFVPFAILVLQKTGQEKLLVPVIVLQTVAANLGSMCTPIGNPQNLYLFTAAGLSIGAFLKLMLPLTILSALLLCFAVCLIKKEPIADLGESEPLAWGQKGNKWKLILFTVLFLLCLLTVLHMVPYQVTLGVILVAMAVADPRLFKQADYILLLTFVAFFVFVGNMKNVPIVHAFLSNCVNGNEILVSILASQVISNVPAAVLLSGFTDNLKGLLIGTNVGGLGTLIASMASLISYKLYAGTGHADVKKYIFSFTLVNLVFLILLSVAAFLY
ncbi:MAG: SLC13 family permease [Lachnospiraceae bacterium]|nr:SLC13 family permease [Lachnospiraceae bacterium]